MTLWCIVRPPAVTGQSTHVLVEDVDGILGHPKSLKELGVIGREYTQWDMEGWPVLKAKTRCIVEGWEMFMVDIGGGRKAVKP